MVLPHFGGGVFYFLPDNVDLASARLVFGHFNLTDDCFHVFYFIHTVVVDGMTIRGKFAARIPIADSKWSNPEKAGDLLNHEIFFWHRMIR